ncbi:MmcQ/YjbR family DNA-binding protein [Nocardia terpenica]|uniref:MmcQ/YjbR family DNA-binding protein n=1 Tax=Nocardia terpenica TaxID=455432 RepID=UPI001893BD82|nr:MmcQ/YjbR family DNA-binding protein [Nocardia terpenica]MBF6065187.1 MmcQ/YjbR family DNA-binding protein [Nocardia terpenica]MBF6107914.1 MmcQ/YjbR family DNA-binding protein [Nocardia terpenica]MBF6115555.1 MmcQ/YjbR family DNA-binding protein [Nocardia terpenica]MBF6121992.1 MmcQ/YjbR family DNA-binding protein [Nocardia terpenica]MBF6155464.1 MmcQ/YjbR family DNA-binding protein [Nocardia terpenica]
MTDDPVHRLRELCSALPEVTECLNHGEPSWTVRRKTLVTFSERKPVGRVGFWCPAPPGELEALVGAEPERFFRPPFGGRGWVGVYLDVPVDWTETREMIVEAYRMIAPKKLVDKLDRTSTGERRMPRSVRSGEP